MTQETLQPSQRAAICPACNGAGGDNQHIVCHLCEGSGGVLPASILSEHDSRVSLEAETYRDMHEIATERLGYDSILEALEDSAHLKNRVEKLEAALNAWRETSFFVDYGEDGSAHVLSETEAVKRAGYQGGDVQMAVQATFRALNGGSDAE